MGGFIWAGTGHCQHIKPINSRCTRSSPAIAAFKPSLTWLASRGLAAPHLSHIPRPFFRCVGSVRGARSGVAIGDPSRRHRARSLTGARTARHRVVSLDSASAGASRDFGILRTLDARPPSAGDDDWITAGRAARTDRRADPSASISATSRRFRSMAAPAASIDRRRVSVQWFSGTILTGVCGAALMGGAVFASLDGETNFATRARAGRERAARRDRRDRREARGTRKSDRLPPAGEANAARQIIRDQHDDTRRRSRGGARAAVRARVGQSRDGRYRILREHSAVQCAEAAGRRPAPTACRPTSSQAPSPTPRSPS